MAMSKERSALEGRLRDVFNFIYSGLLDNIERERHEVERERHEVEKRRIHLDKKLDQFSSLLRRFENDVRILLTNDSSDDEQWSLAPGPKSEGSISPPSDQDYSMENMNCVPNERQIFVGGLPGMMHAEELKDIFSRYGRVVGVKLLPKIPGKNACAFVAFDSTEVVRDLLNKPPTFDHGWESGRSQRFYVEAKCSTAMMELPDSYKIFVTNLPRGTRLIDVKKFFERYGAVVGAKLRPWRGRSANRRCFCAYVAFESAETAERVASIGTTYFGETHHQIYLKQARDEMGSSSNYGKFKEPRRYKYE